VDVAGRAGERRVAERVTAEMERDGTPPTAAVFAALAGVAAREGDSEGVERVLSDMTQRGVHPVREVFSALVAAAGRRGDAEAAGAAAARARAAGFEDDPSVIESLVRVCASAGRADLAWEHYGRATSETKSSPFALTRGTYTALVVASGRAGELRRAFEAADLMRAAGYEPDDTTWRELLSSCARAGDADLAWRTYKQSRESGCPPNDVALNIVVGVTLLKIRELTDPENRANLRQQIDADAAALVDPETGERVSRASPTSGSPSGSAEPEWKEWAERAIAAYHEATVAGVRPRLATFSAMLACLRPPTLPALRAADASEAGRAGAGAGRLAHAVAREDDAHEDARKYYPLRALILYEEAQALGVVPKFQLGADGPIDSEYDIRGFPPAAAEVAVLTLLRVFRRYSDAHAGDENVPELPSVTLRVLSDFETEAMSDEKASAADRRLARTGDRVVVLLRRLRFNYGGSLERGRIELSGNVISRWLKAKPTSRAGGLPGTEPRLAGGALTDQARRIRARGLGGSGSDDFGFAPRPAPGRGLGSGASGVDFFGADDQRYSADDGDEGGGSFLRRKAKRSWSRGGSGSRDSRDGDDGDCMMSELSRITGSASGSQSYDDASVDEEGYYD
jgi:pentatricopeptide repeat protein